MSVRITQQELEKFGPPTGLTVSYQGHQGDSVSLAWYLTLVEVPGQSSLTIAGAGGFNEEFANNGYGIARIPGARISPHGDLSVYPGARGPLRAGTINYIVVFIGDDERATVQAALDGRLTVRATSVWNDHHYQQSAAVVRGLTEVKKVATLPYLAMQGSSSRYSINI